MAQTTRAQEVRGTLPGGQFAQIWLGLEPEFSGAQVTVIAEWDRNNPAASGLNFFILDDQGVRRVGDEPLSRIALGAGNPDFDVNAPDNQLGASFNAIGLAKYTIVVSNESSQDASFTLRAVNGFILDDSNQVVNPNAPITGTTTTTTTGVVATETVAVATPAPAATTATTATETTTTTAPVAPATPAPAATTAAVGTPAVVMTTTLSGELPNQNDQHFLGLQPEGSDVQITLRLTFDPQDNSELARRLNFWVLTESGLQQVVNGTDPSDIAIAAGNRVFRGQNNERVASFRASGTGNFTVIVYNNSTVPGSYSLNVEGGLLVDDSGQTNEGKAAAPAISATGTVTTTTTTAATPVAATAATTTTATTATGRVGEPGGTYTVRSGDTLALIARDIYGDIQLYDEICAFNSISDCNVIEVGDVVNLPTRAQLGTTVVATATPAATPAVRATTATTTTAASTPAATTAVTSTTAVTTTSPATTTTPATTTGSTTAGAATTSQTIYDVLAANSNYSELVTALDETGLSSRLDGSGSFTVFAPTNAAFNALRSRFNLTEAQLLALRELPDTLLYHVLTGQTMAESITNGMEAMTLEGKAVNFEIDGTGAKINGANIIATDIPASNGVIHVIDAVIIPPAE
ncbi:MAG: fasciclin domain-containing protein [Caldilineaceae bacterium]|nr:fasciclin domain-containing protein [Caldilineaceae bacterium]